jgi:hypothetical protein
MKSIDELIEHINNMEIRNTYYTNSYSSVQRMFGAERACKEILEKAQELKANMEADSVD